MFRAVCEDCGILYTGHRKDNARSIAANHAKRHDVEKLSPAMQIAANAVSLRLALEAAMARGKMWLAGDGTDPRKVVEEMVDLLSQAPKAVSIARAPMSPKLTEL